MTGTHQDAVQGAEQGLGSTKFQLAYNSGKRSQPASPALGTGSA